MKNFKDGLSGVQNAQFRKVDEEGDSAEVISETKKTDPADTQKS